MTYYIKSGDQFDVTSSGSLDIREELPVGTYTIQQRPMGGPLYFQTVTDLENKGKIYGDHTQNATRIISTYKDRTRNTGVLLTGEKGSGKTLLARVISEECAKINMPTIVITKPWSGDAFEMLINGIEQDCVILFDEFEKTYDAETQEQMLTLLDGLSCSKKLFIFTCNDKWKLDKHLHNRPGRIFYMIEYKGLTADFIREYCNDVLVNKSYIERVVTLAAAFNNFNFDMLKALVEDMNRYDEAPEDTLKLLNAKPESGSEGNANYQITFEDKRYPEAILHEDYTTFKGNPFFSSFRVYGHKSKLAEDIDYGRKEIEEGQADPFGGKYEFNLLVTKDKLVSMKDEEFIYVLDENVTVKLKKKKVGDREWTSYLDYGY